MASLVHVGVLDSEAVELATALQMFGEAVIATAIIVGNLLVLVAIATVSSLQTVTNYGIASLAAADLLVGLLGKCLSLDGGLLFGFFSNLCQCAELTGG